MSELCDGAEDGWDEAVHYVSWGRVCQMATVTEDRPREPGDFMDPDIERWQTIELIGPIEYACSIYGGDVLFVGRAPDPQAWPGGKKQTEKPPVA